jgi:hypothetical protein
MQATSSGPAQTPWLHHDASVWCVPFGQGTHTGEQSTGSVHAEPVAPIFQGKSPATNAHVESTFSLMLSTDLASVAVVGAPEQVAAGGTPASFGGRSPLLFPHAAKSKTSPNARAPRQRIAAL